MDVECQLCHGSGCPACKGTGWMEILGCGMVHPAVLENCRLDAERYTGWAFGMGPHRIALLRYGVPGYPAAARGRHAVPRGGRPAGGRVNVSLRWLEAFLRRELDPADVTRAARDAGRAGGRGRAAARRARRRSSSARVLEVGPHPDPKADQGPPDRAWTTARGDAAGRGLRRAQRDRGQELPVRAARHPDARPQGVPDRGAARFAAW